MSLASVVDGRVVDAGEAAIAVRDRGFLYGDAAFETVRVYGGEPFAWAAHMDRLERTCELLELDHGIGRSTLLSWARLALRTNGLEEAALRLSVTRGVQPGALDPSPDVEPTVVVLARPLERGGLDGVPRWDGPATVEVVPTRKVPPSAVPARAKTHNYLNGILARLDLAPGADEALLRGVDGAVLEGTTSNLFVVRDGVLLTPPADGRILPGITRRAVIELAGAVGIEVERRDLDVEAVRTADEALLTNTTWEIRPVGAVDGVDLDAGPVTATLRRSFSALVERTFYREVPDSGR